MGLVIKTAAVIDDDHNITEIFSEMLELQGLEIIKMGHNGKEAIEIFKEYKPDVMFLDIEMPKMNGIEALKKIRKMDPSARIVIVTGNSSANLEKMLKENVPTAIIFKPFDFEKITQTIDKVNESLSITR